MECAQWCDIDGVVLYRWGHEALMESLTDNSSLCSPGADKTRQEAVGTLISPIMNHYTQQIRELALYSLKPNWHQFIGENCWYQFNRRMIGKRVLIAVGDSHWSLTQTGATFVDINKACDRWPHYGMYKARHNVLKIPHTFTVSSDTCNMDRWPINTIYTFCKSNELQLNLLQLNSCCMDSTFCESNLFYVTVAMVTKIPLDLPQGSWPYDSIKSDVTLHFVPFS